VELELYDPKIKSCTLHWLSQPGSPAIRFIKVIQVHSFDKKMSAQPLAQVTVKSRDSTRKPNQVLVLILPQTQNCLNLVSELTTALVEGCVKDQLFLHP